MYVQSKGMKRDTTAAGASDPKNLVELAVEYCKQGWSIIPLMSPDMARYRTGCAPGADLSAEGAKMSKTPLLRSWKRYQKERADEAQIRAWWAKWPTANIGGICGEISGRVVIDIDPRNGGVRAGHEHTPVEAATGGDGHHLHYLWPDGGLAKRYPKLPGVDIQGEGKYVVLPGSTHHSGQIYAWERHPDCAFRNGVPVTEPAPCPTIYTAKWGGLTAGGEPQKAPSRPKEDPNRWIATALCTPISEGGGPHGGRSNTATKLAGALVGSLGMPDDIAYHTLRLWRDTCCRGEGAPTDEDLDGIITRLREAEDCQQWDEVSWRSHGPEVDLKPFGATLTKWIEYSARITRTPVDAAALVCLGVLSAASTRGHEVDCYEWDEAAGLFTVVGMDSGTRKTPVLKLISRPLSDLEIECATPSEEYYRAKARKDIAKATLSKALRGKKQADVAEIADLQMEADIELPPNKRYLATNVTPEGLEKLVIEQGSICVWTDELSKVLSNMSAYRRNGGADFDVFLAMWSGSGLIRDRVGTGHEARSKVTGSLVGMVQPDALPGLLPPKSREIGLLARFLWAFPRRVRFDPTPVPKQPGMETWWSNKIRAIAKHEPLRWTEPTSPEAEADPFAGFAAKLSEPEMSKITLTEESHRAVMEFYCRMEDAIEQDPGDAEWLSKMHGQLVRVAANLWLLENGPGSAELPLSYIERARQIVDQWLIPHARLAARLVESDSSERAARLIWHMVQDRDRFKPSEIKDLPLSAERKFKGLLFLSRNGWIREDPRAKKKTYLVNPFGSKIRWKRPA